ADFSVTPDPGNPNGIVAGSSDLLTFYVDVRGTATQGLVIIGGVANGAGVPQGTALVTDTWDVRGASMTVDFVDSPYDAVSIGERMAPVTMQISNPGPGDLYLTQADLQFLLGPADVSSTYIVTQDTANTGVIAASGTATLNFFVDVRSIAIPGIVTISGTAEGIAVPQQTTAITDTWDVRQVVIRSIHPPGGAGVGAILKIHGHGFSDTQVENTVYIDGNPVGILYADHHLIRAMVPAATPVGTVNVEVEVNGQWSIPYAYSVVPGGGGVNLVVETEPNGTFGTANPFTLDVGGIQIQMATINPSGDLDYFHITYNPASFPSGALVQLDINAFDLGSSLDSILTAYDQNFTQIGWNDDAGSYDSFLSIPLPASGELYVRVEDWGGFGGINFWYDLSVAVAGSNNLFQITFSDSSVSGYGVSMGDITGDGLPEILGSKVAVNQGDGTFVTGITLDLGAHAVNFGDVDNDGDNDLFVVMHGGTNIFYRNDGYPNLVNMTVSAGLPTTNPSGIFIGLFVDYDNDGWLDILMVDDFVVRMYRNDGTGDSFTPMTGATNIGLDNVVMSGHCSSAAFGDYDNDGDQDLFIVRELGNRDILMEYDSTTGMYSDVTTAAGVAGPSIFLDDGYSVEWGDFNNDGWLDVYVANYTNSLPNYYYENLQNKTFVSLDLGNVSTPTYDNDGSAADFNNDGWLDILVSNLLYINLDGAGFREVSAEYGLAAASSWMAALGDVEGNGSIDIFDSTKLFVSQGNGLYWIELELVGGAPNPGMSNKSAIGARVTVTAGNLSMIREVNGGSGYVGQRDLIVHFGLGQEPLVDEIEIQWPSGIVQTVTNVSANQRLVINEN
ncbi:MAG: FG-GAP-like repeat-containing protein, partial [Planctomycetota bacterium]|nr:FG-GAP-like repeat-containing protein [Planctomycetota bacterium]